MKSSLLSFRFECSGNLQLNFDAVMDTPKVQTNGSAVDWYKKLKSGGKVSETKIKDEALLFSQVSPEEHLKDKKVFKIRLEDLLKKEKGTILKFHQLISCPMLIVLRGEGLHSLEMRGRK